MPRVLTGLFRRLAGTFAILVTVEGGDAMYALKRDSPLVLGLDEGRTFAASDIYAFSDATDRAVFFDDDEWAVLRPEGFRFFDKAGRPVAKRVRRFAREPEPRRRGGAGHHMLREIREEPEAVERLLFSLAHDQRRAFDELAGLIRRSRKVIFASCGTSYHASLLGSYFLHRAGIECQTLIASEFRHFADVDSNTLVIALSQSGETMDVIDALKYAAGKGGRVAAVVNVPHSTVQRMSRLTLNILAGREICVASTKAFVNQAVLLLVLARKFGFRVDAADIPDKIRAVIRRRASLEAMAREMARSRDLYIIGRGLTYPVARETALKIKETSYIHAEGMMGGELKHGTLALIEDGDPCHQPHQQRRSGHHFQYARGRGAGSEGLRHHQQPGVPAGEGGFLDRNGQRRQVRHPGRRGRTAHRLLRRGEPGPSHRQAEEPRQIGDGQISRGRSSGGRLRP